jgi:hypothetical protein
MVVSKLDQNDRPATVDSNERPLRGVQWRLPLLLALVLVAIVAVRWSRQQSNDGLRPVPQTPPPAAVDGKTVALRIDFADGNEREFDAIGWFPEMTVEDVLAAASRLPDGIHYQVRGSGAMTMLDSIEGVENASRDGRYWLYRVNGELADRSMAVYALEPGDRVLWSFSEPE